MKHNGVPEGEHLWAPKAQGLLQKKGGGGTEGGESRRTVKYQYSYSYNYKYKYKYKCSISTSEITTHGSMLLPD